MRGEVEQDREVLLLGARRVRHARETLVQVQADAREHLLLRDLYRLRVPLAPAAHQRIYSYTIVSLRRRP